MYIYNYIYIYHFKHVVTGITTTTFGRFSPLLLSVKAQGGELIPDEKNGVSVQHDLPCRLGTTPCLG